MAYSTSDNPSSTFVGMGRNPDPEMPDIPIGLGMHIADNPAAMASFSKLDKEQKKQLIHYVQSAGTGEDASRRIRKAVDSLAQGTTLWL